MLVLAILIAFATIYGRYHFAIDTVAGLALALVGWGLSTQFRTGQRGPEQSDQTNCKSV